MKSFLTRTATVAAAQGRLEAFAAAQEAHRFMASQSRRGNKGVVYKGKAGEVAVEEIGYPKLELPEQKRKCVGASAILLEDG